MKGLELARRYFESCGSEALLYAFPDVMAHSAVGLCGEGSECLGYDDDISSDHDFEPAFCIFIPDDTDEKTVFRLERAYAKLPQEFEGYKRSITSPVGGRRHGIIKAGDFFEKFVGSRDGSLTLTEWTRIPPHYLLSATNGEIFYDGDGKFSKIRENLGNMPDDAWKKRLAGHLLMAKQAGQYNFMRCVEHGEYGAAQLSAIEFASHAVSAIFLLNRAYEPFYKWKFRAMRALPVLGNLSDVVEFLISTESDARAAENKYGIIEDVAGMIIEELQRLGVTDAICGDLEKHAYSINDKIKDNNLRQSNILAAI